MNESAAWLTQARSDLLCAERVLELEEGTSYCQAIAKHQQAVEKSIKALIAGLREHRGLGVTIGWGHSVEKFLSALVRPTRSSDKSDLQAIICRCFDAQVRAGVGSLDRLVPRRPAPGASPVRNTEYPFLTHGNWHAPAEETIFTRAEVERFRKLAHKVLSDCSRLVASVQRV